jgi:hypothetical protein
MLWAATTPHSRNSGGDERDRENVWVQVAHVLVGSSKSWDELKLSVCIASCLEAVGRCVDIVKGHAHAWIPDSAIATGVTEEGNQDSKRAVWECKMLRSSSTEAVLSRKRYADDA